MIDLLSCEHEGSSGHCQVDDRVADDRVADDRVADERVANDLVMLRRLEHEVSGVGSPFSKELSCETASVFACRTLDRRSDCHRRARGGH
jgi:hypothetical protein